jgi:type II secretory pathway pseudopilin PulG
MSTWLPAFHTRRLPKHQRGVVLLALLLALALSGIGLMAAVDVWSVTRQREREKELLFVGDQYRQAIQRYYYGAPPGAGRVLPASLDVLLEDDRYPVPVHHLRRLYPDPITGSAEWGLVRAGERIAGVHSLSEAKPLKQAGFPAVYQFFADKTSYRDWLFAFVGARRSGSGVPAPAPAASSSTPSFNPTRPTPGNPS